MHRLSSAGPHQPTSAADADRWLRADGAAEAVGFQDIIHDIDGLFGLLDEIAKGG